MGEKFRHLQTVSITAYGINIFSHNVDAPQLSKKVALRLSGSFGSQTIESEVELIRSNNTYVYKLKSRFYTLFCQSKFTKALKVRRISIDNNINSKQNFLLLELFNIGDEKILSFYGRCFIDVEEMVKSENICKWYLISDRKGKVNFGSIYTGVFVEIPKFDLRIFN